MLTVLIMMLLGQVAMTLAVIYRQWDDDDDLLTCYMFL